MAGVSDFPSVLVSARLASGHTDAYVAVQINYLPEKSDIVVLINRPGFRAKTLKDLALKITTTVEFKHGLNNGCAFSIINLPYALARLDDCITTEFRPLTQGEMSTLTELCDGYANELRKPHGTGV